MASTQRPYVAGPPAQLGADKRYLQNQLSAIQDAIGSLASQGGTATPLSDGTAAVGTSAKWAHEDHVHPSDTTRAPLASPALTGVPTVPTAAPGTNTTQAASTAFVLANGATPASATPLVDSGSGAVGTATKYAREDHVHPTDTSRAPLASPALTGTPTSTTPSTPDNSTKIATTAFVNNSGAWVLLNTLTASGSPLTLGDTTSITSAYSEYEIVFTELVPATNNVALEFQVHSASAFKNSGYLCGGATSTSAGGFSQLATPPTTYIQMSFGANVGNAAPGISGSIRGFNPSASQITHWTGLSQAFRSGATVSDAFYFGGSWNSSGVIDGFQILFSSGNIASGTVKIYGRK